MLPAFVHLNKCMSFVHILSTKYYKGYRELQSFRKILFIS